MSQASDEIKNITEAIKRLESAGHAKAQEVKAGLEQELSELKVAFEKYKPQLEELKSKLETETKEAKRRVEGQVRENPWVAVGLVGLFALMIGWLIGRGRK